MAVSTKQDAPHQTRTRESERDRKRGGEKREGGREEEVNLSQPGSGRAS